jgi:hypothetical protein
MRSLETLKDVVKDIYLELKKNKSTFVHPVLSNRLLSNMMSRSKI